MLNATVTDLLDAIARLDVNVGGEEISAIRRGCETAIAKTMEPTRAFDELMLYQLTKAASTAQFLERCAGLSPAEAGRSVTLARKLKAMPLTEAAWIAGTISSGQVRAIASNVTKRLADRYTTDEADVLRIVEPLDAKETDTAMQRWVNYAQAQVDDDPEKPPREDEFFHSEISGGQFVSNGSFGKVTGAVIAKAIELAETDNPRDDDTRSPAQRRGEALADVCNFYVDYQNRITTDPDAEAPAVPKKRNWPQLIGVSTTGEIGNRGGAQLLNGPHIDHQAFEALSCTAQLLRLVLDENGAIRSYELMPASVTDALFGAVAARDQHCRWPGCHKKPIHCDVHHLHYRENGGPNTPCLLVRLRRNGLAAAPRERSCGWSWNPTAPFHITYPDGTTETTKPPIRQPGLPWNR